MADSINATLLGLFAELSLSRACLLLLLVCCPALAVAQEPEEWPRTIDAVELHGLWRTDGTVVTRELPWKPSDRVSHEDWELGIQRLWNLGIFSQVGAHVETRDQRVVAVFDLEERWTINILFRFGSSGDIGWVRVGLWDINTFGRYIETGGLYERFGDQNGGMAWIRNPRLFDRRLELQVTASRLARPRPSFTTVRNALRLELTNEQSDTLRYGGWAEGSWDTFLHGGFGDLRPPVTLSVVFGPTVKFGLVNTMRLRQTGWSVELRPSAGVPSRGPVFGTAWVEALWFRMVGEPWTFAARLQGGAMTNSPPQFHFFLTGLDHVRGFEDNFVETQLYAVANLEARFIAFDSMWFAVMPAAFIDAAVAQKINGSPVGVLSAGLGARFMIPRIYHSGLRLDVGWPLAPLRRELPRNVFSLFSIGVYQYF